MILKYLSTIALILLLATSFTVGAQAPSLISLNLGKSPLWRSEFEYPDRSSLYYDGETIVIESFGGATLWLDSLLTGDYVIEYERMVVVDTGQYDRLSDLNQFWLANEAHAAGKLLVKDGSFASYDNLNLFYVGMGGNSNSTTRFRYYDGTGARSLLEEKNEQPYLLLPNVYYKVKTVVSSKKGYTAFYINDHLLFRFEGALPQAGFFGFRQTASRQKIRNVRIYK